MIKFKNASEVTRNRRGKLCLLWDTPITPQSPGNEPTQPHAIRVARARGMSRVAKRCGLGRESLYKALSDSGNPAFTTIVGVASALGYTFEMRAASAKRAG